MADTAEESPAQRQARLRREKRAAKIQAGGDDRLAKITGVAGRPAPAVENVNPATPSQQPRQAYVSAEDPAEVDISQHHWTPQSRNDVLQQFDGLQGPQGNPFAGMPGLGSTDGASEDPMMRMMQQMLGAAGGAPPTGDPNDPNDPMAQLPPFLKAMMSGQQQTQQQQEAQGPKTNSAYIWRIVHAVMAFSLALYIALTGTFNGSKLSRAQSVEGMDFGPRLFYMFATAELVLQSSRYFVEKGQLQGGGMLATIANSGLVPEPWGGYIRTLGRYSVIWQTLVGDAMIIVFVLGLLAWWKGMAAS